MSLAKFDRHLKDPYPAFRCYASGDRSEALKFTARVTHEIGDPATRSDEKLLSEFLGDAGAEFIRFAKAHDGVKLYEDGLSETVGIAFYRAAEIQEQTKDMLNAWDAMGWEEDSLPEWMATGVAIGEIPQSANYFVLGTEGGHSGKIFYADHDDFNEEPIADTFEQFLEMIIKDPPGFLYERGCYTRYSDGKTNKQWIPAEYVPDALQ